MNYFNVGKIVNAQGLQKCGSCLWRNFAEERFKKGAELALFDEGSFCPNGDHASHRKRKTSISSSLRIILLHINIRKFRGFSLQRLQKEDLTDLEDGEFYYHKLSAQCLRKWPANRSDWNPATGANDVQVEKRKANATYYYLTLAMSLEYY